MNKNQTESKPPSVEEPADEGLDETTCSEVWITHTGGAWMIGVGDEIGHVMWSTSSMGKSFSVREPVLTLLARHPNMKKIVVTLIRANAEQLNLPNTD